MLLAPVPEDEPEEGAVNLRWYGTRVSTVVLVQDDGQTTFVERDMAILEDGAPRAGTDERVYQFQCHE
jgi:uncharacterized protein with NRDE domain